MKKLLPYIFLLGITILFFYKTFFFGLIPFPGDLLISEYQPWKSYSYLGYNPGSYPSKKQYFDTIRQIYPWRTFVNTEIKKGNIPLWNPFNFSGQPLMANNQSQVFYPLTIIYGLFSQTTAWTILVILQPFLAALGMFLYLRCLQRSQHGSIFGAILYGFSLYMTVFLEYNTIGHVIVWLPFLVFSLEKIAISTSLKYRMLFILSFICCAFGGHLQIFAAIVIFTIIYSFHALPRSFSKKELLLLFMLATGITAVQYLPTLELIIHSARSNHEYSDLIDRLLVSPKQLFTFINPDLFGNPATGNYINNDSYPGKALFFGAVGFFFTLVSFFHLKKDKIVNFYKWTFISIVLIVVNTPLTQLLYKIQIPLLSQSAPGNFLFLLVFCGAVLAAHGLDAWQKQNIKTLKPSISMIAMIVLLWILYALHTIQIQKSMLLFGTAIVVIIQSIIFTSITNKFKNVGAYILIALSIGELWYSFQKFNPFVPAALVFPKTEILSLLKTTTTHERFLGYGNAFVEANFATQEQLYDANGYDPLYPKWYGQLITAATNGKISAAFDTHNRSDATIRTETNNDSFLSNPYRTKLINLLGIKYILDKKENASSEKTFPLLDFQTIAKDEEWTILNNTKVLPRAFLSGNYSIPDSFEKIFFADDFFPQQTVLLEEKIPDTINSADGSVSIQTYESNTVTLEATAAASQLLVLTDTYYPGWKAYVNGIETPIFRAYHAFRAIVIPQGKSTITFIYKPLSYTAGLAISLVSILATIIYITFKRKPKI